MQFSFQVIQKFPTFILSMGVNVYISSFSFFPTNSSLLTALSISMWLYRKVDKTYAVKQRHIPDPEVVTCPEQ